MPTERTCPNSTLILTEAAPRRRRYCSTEHAKYSSMRPFAESMIKGEQPTEAHILDPRLPRSHVLTHPEGTSPTKGLPLRSHPIEKTRSPLFVAGCHPL